MSRHRIRTAAAGAIILILALLGSATPASAGTLDVTCTPPSSVAVTYDPPLTASPQTVTSTTNQQYGPCVSASVPGLTSGSRFTVVTSSGLSCLELLAARPFGFTITWNTGQTSTISGNLVANLSGGVLTVTVTGTVTSGLFAGDTVVQQQVGAATDLTLCTLGQGTVSSHYGLVTLEITSV
ncbi:hypothetical protein MF672_031045 [Actinomadura sp. ATCC 31491]|uniref:Ig-like domain-containing protein n=1 Tax=Actinomadura luzonensis TaxID=2805427 RepID=A0ABT0G0R3_9ACTN|nr:hypothetical protein [Actinomadura luzonensis]MCK2218195.1 hypothetical protein [Actinomadura luzonensis]